MHASVFLGFLLVQCGVQNHSHNESYSGRRSEDYENKVVEPVGVSSNRSITSFASVLVEVLRNGETHE